jgi:hypothetical protein
MKKRRFRGLVAVAILLIAASAHSNAQLDQLTGVRYYTGQNVAPVFEGWEKNPDGSFSFVFGYLNRNYEEEPEIAIGPGNGFSPGAVDRGQPTHFYPRRQQFMFKVRVPADFGKQELVWTLTRAGKTEKAVAHLALEWELTEIVYSQNRAGLARDSVTALPNKAPTVAVNGTAPIAATVGTPVTLTVTAADDGIPKTAGQRGGAGAAAGAGGATAGAAPGAAVPGAAAGGSVAGGATALPPRGAGAAPASAEPERGAGGRGRGGPPAPPPLVNVRQGPVQQALIRPARTGLAVTWTHWRGPGRVAFKPPTMVVKDGVATTQAVFSAPGTYVVRAFADDGVLLGSGDVTVSVTGAPK